MWAMMQKFRRTAGSVRPGAGAAGMGTEDLRRSGWTRSTRLFHAGPPRPDSSYAAPQGSARSAGDAVDAGRLEHGLDLERGQPRVLASHQRDHAADVGGREAVAGRGD